MRVLLYNKVIWKVKPLLNLFLFSFSVLADEEEDRLFPFFLLGGSLYPWILHCLQQMLAVIFIQILKIQRHFMRVFLPHVLERFDLGAVWVLVTVFLKCF